MRAAALLKKSIRVFFQYWHPFVISARWCDTRLTHWEEHESQIKASEWRAAIEADTEEYVLPVSTLHSDPEDSSCCCAQPRSGYAASGVGEEAQLRYYCPLWHHKEQSLPQLVTFFLSKGNTNCTKSESMCFIQNMKTHKVHEKQRKWTFWKKGTQTQNNQ